MCRLLALALVTLLLVGAMAPAASAGGATNAALGLASFAVFTQLFGGLFHPVYAAPVAYPPYPVVYPPVTYAPYPVGSPPPPPTPTVIQYPHGRYELRGDGVALPYYWVWIPTPPPPPAPPPPPGSSVPRAPAPSSAAPPPSGDPYHP